MSKRDRFVSKPGEMEVVQSGQRIPVRTKLALRRAARAEAQASLASQGNPPTEEQ